MSTDLNNALIIADSCYKPLLLRYKNEHPEFNFSIVNERETLENISFQCDEKEAISRLIITLGYDYNKAKTILNYLRYLLPADSQLPPEFEESYNLINDLLKEPTLGLYEYKIKRIFLFEMDENRQLKALLVKRKIPFSLLHISDLGIEKRIQKENEFLRFETRDQQYLFLFSLLRKKLLCDSLDYRKVVIFTSDGNTFFAQAIADANSLKIQSDIKTPLTRFQDVKLLLLRIDKEKNFTLLEEEKQNPNLAIIVKAIEDYKLAFIPSFSLAYSSLLEIVNSLSTRDYASNYGLLLTDNLTFDLTKEVYILDFKYDVFYSVKKDNALFIDRLLYSLNLNTSYDKTALDKRKKLNYIEYMDVKLFSSIIRHGSEKIYDSQFLEGGYPFSFNQRKIDVCSDDFTNGHIYTSKAKRLFYTAQLDSNFQFKPYLEYLSYDHSFKGVSVDIFAEKRRYSLTSLEQYSNCPYKFYLGEVLPSFEDDKTNMVFGTFVHALFERSLQNGYDFEEELAKAKEEYKNNFIENVGAFDSRQEVLLDVKTHYLRIINSAVKEMRGDLTRLDDSNDFEKKIEYTISDGDNEYNFQGRIDKVLQSGTQGNLFYTIIDYKTGSENFDKMGLPIGNSIQLPLYYYALESSKNRFEYLNPQSKFGGFGIQHTYFKSLNKLLSDKKTLSFSRIREHLKIKGFLIADSSYRNSLSSKKKTPFFDLSGQEKVKINDRTGYAYIKAGNRQVTPYYLYDIVDDSKSSLVAIIKLIKEGVFPIAPKEKMPICAYCQYGDICYRNASLDSVDYKEDIERYLRDGFEPKAN